MMSLTDIGQTIYGFILTVVAGGFIWDLRGQVKDGVKHSECDPYKIGLKESVDKIETLIMNNTKEVIKNRDIDRENFNAFQLKISKQITKIFAELEHLPKRLNGGNK
jgi:hypothetical protein